MKKLPEEDVNNKYFGDAEASGSLVSQSTDVTRILDDLEATCF